MSNHDVKPFHVMEILARCKEMEARGIDVIHMEIGEPDFDTPETINQAGINALNNNLTRYTSAQGLFELRQEISNDYLQRFKLEVDSEDIIITPGASGGLHLTLSYLLQGGRRLMIADPCYPCNRNVAQLVGGKITPVPVNSDTRFQLNTHLIKQNWQEDLAAVLVASPSNPTGTVCDKSVLLDMAEFLAEKNAYLVVDEIYQGLTYDIAAESVAGLTNNIIVLNSFSKFFGMTGWRAGWLVAPKQLISSLDAIAQNTYLATSTIAQHAALKAFQSETMHILEQRRKIFHERRNFLYKALTDLGLKIPVMPQGAFYIYADISDYSDNSFKFCQELLESQALAITPGCDFGEYRANEFVRFAYTTNEYNLMQGIDRLKQFLAK